MPIINSPLRYPGGKSALTDFLTKTISNNRLTGGTYVEPFCGGAGAAINLLLSGHVSRIILNDIDPVIYAFWHSILYSTDKFINLVDKTPVTIDEWHNQKSILENSQNNLVNLGFAAFFLNRCNRSGILRANPIGGLHQTGKWKINARFNKNALIKRINAIVDKKEQIQIKNKDVLSFLREDVFPLQEAVFVYLDPPYFKQGPGLYLNALSPDGHKKLAAILEKEKVHVWLTTYDNVAAIKEMYPHSSITNFSLNYSAHLHKKGEELLITPPHTKLPAEAIQPYYGLKIFSSCLAAQ